MQQQYMVTIQETGESFFCKPGQSILEGMASLGRKGIPCGCRGGGCGVCKVEIVSGQFSGKPMSRSHVTAQDEQEGRVLACRVYPDSDICLRVLGCMSRAVMRCQLAA